MKTNPSSDSLQVQLYSLLIPKEILQYFEITTVVEREKDITLELVEKADTIPKDLPRAEAVLNGYMNQLELQNFPIQGKACYLRLIRRRWKRQGTENGASYFNEYDFAAPGTKATKEFGVFLKEYLR